MQIGAGRPCSLQFTVSAAPEDVVKTVAGVAATESSCGFVIMSDTQLVITRRYLPWWCVIVGIGLLLFIVGFFFFFFSMQEERLLITVVSDGWDTHVDIQGRIKPEIAGRIQAALSALGGHAAGPGLANTPTAVTASGQASAGSAATQERAAQALENAEIERIAQAGLQGTASVTCTPSEGGLSCTGIITASDGSAAEKIWQVEVAPYSGALRWSKPTVRMLPAASETGCPRCSAKSAERVWCEACTTQLATLRRVGPPESAAALCREMDAATSDQVIEVIDQRYSSDFTAHTSDRPGALDKASSRAAAVRLATMFPEMSCKHVGVVGDGDRVWSDYRLHASGGSGTYDLSGVAAYRLNSDGLVAESWTYPGLKLPE